ncbi:MAG: tRNA adenosine(34) deaminase TadA [Clostridiales bacterium]|jgi:tRNA(adenine34) deaminase|nr:tRNA adenosine(34) deaminase TadA [Clostridiales bacterium]
MKNTADFDKRMIREALKEAKKALEYRDVPVGCVLVRDGAIVARAHNRRERDNRPTAHAEVLCIDAAAKRLGAWNLSGCTLYVTLEPCVMCAGAIVYARIDRVVFGAYDKRFGCAGSVHNLLADPKFNHRALVTGGVLEAECLAPIQEFFKAIRFR